MSDDEKPNYGTQVPLFGDQCHTSPHAPADMRDPPLQETLEIEQRWRNILNPPTRDGVEYGKSEMQRIVEGEPIDQVIPLDDRAAPAGEGVVVGPKPTKLEAFDVTCKVCGLSTVLLEVGVPERIRGQDEETYAVILTCLGCHGEERVSS